MTMATDEQVDEFIALIDETRPVQLFHHIDEATVGAGRHHAHAVLRRRWAMTRHGRCDCRGAAR